MPAHPTHSSNRPSTTPHHNTQVPTLEQDDYLKLFYTLAHALLVFTLATMPTLVLNAPVGVIARIVSSREQKRALAASRVKIEARDVVMSKKITLSIVLVPTLWITYAVLLLKYTRLQPATVLVLFLCCPLFSYIGVMATEAGMVDFKDLKVRSSAFLYGVVCFFWCASAAVVVLEEDCLMCALCRAVLWF